MGVLRGLLRRLGRLVGVASFTGVEVVALAGWLTLVTAEPLGPASEVVGLSLLFGGLLLEGLLTHVTVNGFRRSPPTVAMAGFTTTETLLWVGWLAAIRLTEGLAGVLGAGLALAVALVVRHTVADNAFRGLDPLSSLVQRATVGFGVVEAAGATAWFLVVSGAVWVPGWVVAAPTAGFSANAVVGAALLACAVFVRHLLAVRHALRTNRPASEPGWRSSRGTIRE